VTVSDTLTWIQCSIFTVIVIENMSWYINYWYLFSADG